MSKRKRRSISAGLRETLLARQQGMCYYYHSCGAHFGHGVHSHVHHIDGDTSNNDPDNLMLLCPNHHDKLERDKRMRQSMNKGRKERNQPQSNIFDFRF